MGLCENGVYPQIAIQIYLNRYHHYVPMDLGVPFFRQTHMTCSMGFVTQATSVPFQIFVSVNLFRS